MMPCLALVPPLGSESASCGAVDDASWRSQLGVVVPTPIYPLPKNWIDSLLAVVVAKPTLPAVLAPQAVPVLEINPVAEKVAQPAVPPPLLETKSCEVEAVPVMLREDEVALVEKRLVKVPLLAKKLVLVLLVVVPCKAVKFWRVDEPVVRKLPAVKRLVMFAFVPESMVEKKVVVVAFDPVAFTKVKFWRVLEPVARKLVVVAKVKSAEVTESKLVLGLKVKPVLPVNALVPLQKVTWLATPLPV